MAVLLARWGFKAGPLAPARVFRISSGTAILGLLATQLRLARWHGCIWRKGRFGSHIGFDGRDRVSVALQYLEARLSLCYSDNLGLSHQLQQPRAHCLRRDSNIQRYQLSRSYTHCTFRCRGVYCKDVFRTATSAFEAQISEPRTKMPQVSIPTTSTESCRRMNSDRGCHPACRPLSTSLRRSLPLAVTSLPPGLSASTSPLFPGTSLLPPSAPLRPVPQRSTLHPVREPRGRATLGCQQTDRRGCLPVRVRFPSATTASPP